MTIFDELEAPAPEPIRGIARCFGGPFDGFEVAIEASVTDLNDLHLRLKREDTPDIIEVYDYRKSAYETRNNVRCLTFHVQHVRTETKDPE